MEDKMAQKIVALLKKDHPKIYQEVLKEVPSSKDASSKEPSEGDILAGRAKVALPKPGPEPPSTGGDKKVLTEKRMKFLRDKVAASVKEQYPNE